MAHDPVDAPLHYTQHKQECIDVSETMSFCRGNALKYVWRAGAKEGCSELEDLRKARWYLDREIKRLEKAYAKSNTGPVPKRGPSPSVYRNPDPG